MKNTVPQALSKQLNRPVSLGKAAFNPFTLELQLENGTIGPALTNAGDETDPILTFNRLFLDIESRSFLSGALVTQSTELNKLFIHVVRGADGKLNLHTILPQTRNSGNQERPLAELLAASPVPFSLGNLRLNEARLHFDDRTSGKTHTVENIYLSMPVVVSAPSMGTAGFISKVPLLPPKFSATVNGSPIDLTGESKIEPNGWTAIMKVELKDFNLANFPVISVSSKNKKGLTQGIANINGRLDFSANTGGRLALTFSGDGLLRDVLIEGEEENSLRVGIATFSGTFEPLIQSFQFKEITLTNPELRTGTEHEWLWPLADLESDHQSTFFIDNFTIKNGSLTFTDRVSPGNPSIWSEVELTIQGITIPSRTQTSYSLHAKSEGDTKLNSQGALTLDPFSMDGNFKVSATDTSKLSLLKKFLPENMKPSGRLASLTGRYSIQPKNEEGEKAWFLTDFAFALENFSIEVGEERWLHVPVFAMRDGQVNSEEKSVDLGMGEGEADELLLRWDQTGKFNWSIFQDKQTSGDHVMPDWSFGLQSLTIKQTAIKLESQGSEGAAQNLRLDNLSATAGALSSRKDAQGTVSGSMTIDDKGYIGFGGYISLSPPSATLQCDVTGIPVNGLAPFLKDWFRPEVTGGILQAKGTFKLPESQFTGLAAVMDFAANAEGRKVFGFSRLIAQDATLNFSPFALDIKILSMEHPYLFWRISAEGKSGLSRLFGSADPTAVKQKTSHPFRIGETRITDGNLDFQDDTVTPVYQTGVASISGIISGFDGVPENRATVNLQGVAGSRAAVNLNGLFGFFGENLFADVEFKASGVDLTTIAQYVEPGLGYKVDQGNLNMTTRYRSSAGSVEAENTALLTNFKLGKRLNGGLAMPLTLALLTNRQGELSLELPFSGGADDPAFSFKVNLIAMFRNLLLKAAVSPFSVLSSLLPDQNILRYENIVFPYGSSELNEENRAQLKEMIKVFYERPGLRLKLRGMADAKGDRDAIAAERLQGIALRTFETGEKITQKGAAVEPAVTVKDDELLKLAGKRASVIRNALLSLGMRPEQLTIEAKASLVNTEDTGEKHGNRVEFLLESLNGFSGSGLP